MAQLLYRAVSSAALLWFLAGSLLATNRTVTSIADSGAGSLRDAINASVSGDSIDFSVTGTITLTSGELHIANNVTINGPGARVLTISGNDASRVFNVSNGTTSGPNVTIGGLTIDSGNGNFTNTGGGGIYNDHATLTVNSVTVSNSKAGLGGGIYNDGGSAMLSDCTLSMNSTKNSLNGNGGGAIYNNGTVTVTGSTLSGNSAIGANSSQGVDGNGGGILNDGTITLSNCTLSGNSATGGAASNAAGDGGAGKGGGICNNGTLTLTNCTLNGNSVTGGLSGDFSPTYGGSADGGAISSANGTVTLTNCTLSGNSATGGQGSGTSAYQGRGAGGGISSTNAMVTLTNCTLSGNSAQGGGGTGGFGGGLAHFQNFVVNALNNIVAGNSSATGPDVYANVTSQGHNLIGNTDGSTGWIASDLTGTSAAPLDAKLDSLEDNGGPTQTLELLPGSPAIDAGDDTVLGPPLSLTTDQRGPGFPRKRGNHVDIGAFEYESDPTQNGPGFVVTTNVDDDDGFCGVTHCTLREAIHAANTTAGAATITFAPTVTGTIFLQTGSGLGQLVITNSVTIMGPGARVLAVSGKSATAVFFVSAGPSTISGLTVRDGLVTSPPGALLGGAGITNLANLTLSDCAVIANQAFGLDNTVNNGNAGGAVHGAGIYNTGVLTLNRCTFSGNSAIGGRGGANFNLNSTGGSGGGAQGGAVSSDTNSSLSVYNCTFSGDTAIGGAGGIGHIGGAGGSANAAIFNRGAMTVVASTFSANSGMGGVGGGGNGGPPGMPGRGSGGLTAAGGTNVVGDTISAGNTGNNGGGRDVDGAFSSGGYNLIGSGDHSTGFANGNNHDQVGTDTALISPQLGPLQNNDGPTDTMALLSNSPAIDKGDDSVLGAPSNLTTDQRGYPRKIGSHVDVGAFEYDFGERLRIISIVRSGNDIVITFQAIQGVKYRLERELAITDSMWNGISGVNDLVAPSNGSAQITDPGGTSLGKAFYRVRLLP